MSVISVFALALALTGADVAASQDTGAEAVPVVITNPEWRVPPTVEDTDYPLFASHLGIDARVMVECTASVEGHPRCEAVSSTVEGMGFEAAAVNIVQRGTLTPRLVDGQPVESTIRLNVPFRSEEEPPSTVTWDGPEPTPANLLSGLVAAQSLARSPSLQSQIDWGLHQLPPERARVIQDWITELYIGRANVRLMARAIALVLAKRGAEVVPNDNPPDWPEWIREMDTALASLYSAEENFKPLRQRYCETYGCGEA